MKKECTSDRNELETAGKLEMNFSTGSKLKEAMGYFRRISGGNLRVFQIFQATYCWVNQGLNWMKMQKVGTTRRVTTMVSKVWLWTWGQLRPKQPLSPQAPTSMKQSFGGAPLQNAIKWYQMLVDIWSFPAFAASCQKFRFLSCRPLTI